VAEWDQGAGPAKRGLEKLYGRREMVPPADRHITFDRPAVDVGLRDLFRHVLKYRASGTSPRSTSPVAGLRNEMRTSQRPPRAKATIAPNAIR
jgi:hypothetical protein